MLDWDGSREHNEYRYGTSNSTGVYKLKKKSFWFSCQTLFAHHISVSEISFSSAPLFYALSLSYSMRCTVVIFLHCRGTRRLRRVRVFVRTGVSPFSASSPFVAASTWPIGRLSFVGRKNLPAFGRPLFFPAPVEPWSVGCRGVSGCLLKKSENDY